MRAPRLYPEEIGFFKRNPVQSPVRRRWKDRSSWPLSHAGVVTSSMTLSGFYQHPNHSAGVSFLGNQGNSRKREFGEAPCVCRRGERSWSVKGEGNDAAQRYSAQKARLGSEKCLPQARCPRCRGAAPDRKMPCSMWPVPGKGVLSNQKCTLNTPGVHPRAPSGLEVPQQHCRDG